MGSPAAKQGDTIAALDIHQIQPPGTAPPVMVPHPFNGIIDGGLCQSVFIMGAPAATVNSTATNMPPHIPQGGTFVNPPFDSATVSGGSATVMIGGQPAARNGDPADTCNDDGMPQGGTIIASGTVMIG
ncbi:MAG: PAAR domain-containing protein [Dehalococcoidia bacterium]|nr:PAAR domain-containing protein [Dehalococcoidia bacterium]